MIAFASAGGEVIEYLNKIIVVPITRAIRGLATEVVLTPDGMPVVSALNFDYPHWRSANALVPSSVVCLRGDGLKCAAHY